MIVIYGAVYYTDLGVASLDSTKFDAADPIKCPSKIKVRVQVFVHFA